MVWGAGGAGGEGRGGTLERETETGQTETDNGPDFGPKKITKSIILDHVGSFWLILAHFVSFRIICARAGRARSQMRFARGWFACVKTSQPHSNTYHFVSSLLVYVGPRAHFTDVFPGCIDLPRMQHAHITSLLRSTNDFVHTQPAHCVTASAATAAPNALGYVCEHFKAPFRPRNLPAANLSTSFTLATPRGRGRANA